MNVISVELSLSVTICCSLFELKFVKTFVRIGFLGKFGCAFSVAHAYVGIISTLPTVEVLPVLVAQTKYGQRSGKTMKSKKTFDGVFIKITELLLFFFFLLLYS